MPTVTLLGDSTLDNRIWVDGLFKNWLFTRLGIRHSTPEQRIQKFRTGLIKPELSVIENLRVQLPEEYSIHDGTNDGFTSANVLNGAMRSKVFGPQTFSMFPPHRFEPLRDHQADLQQSDYIVLSVGGNDVREFLQNTFRQQEITREFYIQRSFPRVLEQLTTNYLEIIKRIREQNPNARLILMTQYYPSVAQNNYHIYEFMKTVGRALEIGGPDPDPMDVIHHLVTETYRGISEKLNDNNVVIADVSSSLNPYDGKNHTSQIEPSGQGGKKIAKMLHHLISIPVEPGQAYRFTPNFFSEQPTTDSVISTPINKDWAPLHPNTIKTMDAEYQATLPVSTNYSFLLNALATLSISAIAVAIMWLAAAPLAAAIGTAVVSTITIGYLGYSFFAAGKPSTEISPNLATSVTLNMT